MTTDIVTTNNEMVEFSDDMLKRASEMLGCKLDKASAYKALCIQRDTDLSIVRGEISIVSYGGKPTVQINKQGYLAYANRNPDYDGMEHGVSDDGSKAWCKVYSKSRSHPTMVTIRREEFEKDNAIWREKPTYMLEKTAVSLALREAYPILNGTYTEEEMTDAVPYKVEPREDDIVVTPEPQQKIVEEDVAFPLSNPFYTQEQAETIMDNVRYNMPGQILTVDEVYCCKRTDGNYDKAAIDMIFAKKRDAWKASRGN